MQEVLTGRTTGIRDNDVTLFRAIIDFRLFEMALLMAVNRAIVLINNIEWLSNMFEHAYIYVCKYILHDA